MMKKIVITVIAFVMVSMAVFIATTIAGRSVGATISLPRPIEADSPCPATECANGSCHGYDNTPQPDGVSNMTCPASGCSSPQCHGWNALVNGWGRASDASLSLWILFPVLFVSALIAFVELKAGR